MMTYAGHLPTKVFEHNEWLAMKDVDPKSQDWPGEGFFRTRDLSGKPMVFFIPPLGCSDPAFIVRPIVRVKATSQ
jgi:hypothetical protein